MKYSSILFITTLVILSSCFSNENTEVHTEGSFWAIKPPEGHTSYIFGTIHLYPKEDSLLSPIVTSTLKQCDLLLLERDITNAEEQQQFADLQIPAFITESFRAIITEYGENLISMENQLIETAQTNEIEIGGLENSQDLIETFEKLNKISLPDSTYDSQEMLTEYQDIIRLYKNESINEFEKLLNEQSSEEIHTLLVQQRNNHWIKVIPQKVNSQSCFIAVGMGHLGGKKGLLYLLEEQGYTITRIPI